MYVYGGGIAGLTAAHELVIRGFDVELYECEHAPGPSGLLEDVTIGGMARTQYFSPRKKHNPGKGHAVAFSASRPAETILHRFIEEFRSRYLYDLGIPPGPGRGTRSPTYYPEFWFQFRKGNGKPTLTDDSERLFKQAIADLKKRYESADPDVLRQEAEGTSIVVQALAGPDATKGPTPAGNPARAPASRFETAMVERLGKALKRAGASHLAGLVKGTTDFEGAVEPLSPFAVLGLPPLARTWVRVIIYTPMLPGEHGYRFFPSFYRHVFDTMQRIPIYDAAGQPDRGTVYDNLVALPRIAILTERGAPFVTSWEPLQAADTLARVDRSLRDLQELDISVRDVAWFSLRVLRYMTTCPQRRAREMENLSWWEYLEGHDRETGRSRYRYSPNFARLVQSSSRVMAALDGQRGDARTCGNTFVQLLTEALVVTPKNNCTLNGPTSEAWFAHWRKHLESLGVKFTCGKLVKLELEDGHLVARVERPGNQGDGPSPESHPKPDDEGRSAVYFVVATDALAAQEATRDLKPLCGVPLQLQQYVPYAPRHAGDRGVLREARTSAGQLPWDRFQTISGIQYFFRKHVRICDGYVYCVDSEWRLSAICSQIAWQNPPIERLSQYQSVLSIDIGDWRTPSSTLGKAAYQCTPEEIARETLAQLKNALRLEGPGGPPDGDELPEPDYIHIDENLRFGSADTPLERNETPYLVPTAGDWRHRPGPPPWNPTPQGRKVPGTGSAPTGSPFVWQADHGGYWVHWDRLVFAGTWLKTFTRLTTMESANESARHAANAIIDHIVSRGQQPPPAPEPRHLQWERDPDVYPSTARGDYCRIWDPECNELPDLMRLQRLDEENFERGLPHPWDVLGLERLPSLLSKLPQALDPFSGLFDVVTQLGKVAGPQASQGLLAALRQIRAILGMALPQAPRPPPHGPKEAAHG